ncbi:hypothetical protein E8Q33_08815 [Methylophaga sp. SB9B]|uniref:hypothetical protein n=1 Tax=Methylophaga sp. SB9B TaxID=2570356 RepID=UPI0010A80B0B|nr:hypothetical protein [Methylophaga sp. SB9B]THK41211.1 hypothetical protein E8Q33_08815 [Methylophaga sp. SB9B]
MLPHWLSLMKDELNVCIRPNSLILRRFKGLPAKTTCVDQQKIVLKKTMSQAEIESGYLAKVLKEALNVERWQASTATIVVANHLVRYALIPWNSEIKTADESQAYLHHCFISVYGDAVASWNKCQSPAAYGQKALASAMPRELLQTVQDVFSPMLIRFNSVQPYLMTIANQAIAVIKKQNLQSACWLAVIADGRVCLCLLIEGEWCWVKNVQQETDTVAQIEMLIQRERLMNNEIDKLLKKGRQLPMLVHWPDLPVNQKIQLPNHRIIKLASSKLFSTDPAENQITRLITL